ncbi:hypothetical protein PGT21_013480 [Puccinia graminis f. sp. tritici]|uniref:Uncharacterized protein n=1 Tax=Puccinia graminis f. sp. tritici TaxID=56615 RepID=A0A5B0NC85_PUCGR|nr:hypothetical protein PGT21_013480 [Puccinia graminis f. sp. tritici]
MIGVFTNIYKQLDCSPEDDPPALFVDDRLHYALWLIDNYCGEGMEHGEFKDCRDLQDNVTELSTWIVDNFEACKKFNHFNLNGVERKARPRGFPVLLRSATRLTPVCCPG